MGLLSKMLRRSDKTQGPTFKEQICFENVRGEAIRGDGETEVAWKQNLAFKYEAIHDEDIEELLAQKCLVPQLIPKMREDGKGLELQWDDKKNDYVRDGQGNPI